MKRILKGLGVSQGVVKGKVRIVSKKELAVDFDEGDILVTELTNPRMVFLMSKAGGIVCDGGGMTSHPAIVSREMGTPCIVLAKSDEGKPGTLTLKEGVTITINGKTGEVFSDELD